MRCVSAEGGRRFGLLFGQRWAGEGVWIGGFAGGHSDDVEE